MDWISDFDWGGILESTGVIILQLILIWIAYLVFKSIGKRLIIGAFDKMQENGKMSQGRAKVLKGLLLSVLSYTLIFIVIVVVFGIFGLPIGGLIAGAGIVGLAIGFGAQGLVSDIVTGFFILAEKWADVDDYIITAGVDGVVEEIGLRTTKIRDYDGVLHYIPNRNIENLSNYSRGDMRALVEIGFSYNDNIDKAFKVAQEVCDTIAEENEKIVEGPNVDGVETIDKHAVVMRITAQTKNMEQWGVQRELFKSVKEAFDENGIEMPYEYQVNVIKNDEV